ncbi:hypothetical protein [Streptomyces sp. 021-4]|uniref:hypothetical protein n=1 Tax=Streptomyces sp. 021-4 TaxID=2789260 RepID=UPI0039F5C7DB
MTLVATFVRKAGRFTELIFASDSRLSGGSANDYAQKVFQLPRSDALFSFAGDTSYAYPLMNQMIRSIEAYPNSFDRRLPLPKLKGHILRVFQQSYSAIHSLPVGQKYPEDPDNFFVIGGFDWQTGTHGAWSLSFNPSVKAFAFRSILRGQMFCFTGDNIDAVKFATRSTYELLREKGKDQSEIDMEPFEILASVIKSGTYPGIGGAPQLGKCFQHLNTQLYQVLWPENGSGISHPHMTGRPLLPGERSIWPLFDPLKGFPSLPQESGDGDYAHAEDPASYDE